VTEDKPSEPIPKEAENAANRLLYRAPRAKDSEAGTEKDRQGPEEVEWVIQWTYGMVQRLAAKTKIGIEKRTEHSPEENKESHVHGFRPSTELLKRRFGDFIVAVPSTRPDRSNRSNQTCPHGERNGNGWCIGQKARSFRRQRMRGAWYAAIIPATSPTRGYSTSSQTRIT
jgi:hypothetical protein